MGTLTNPQKVRDRPSNPFLSPNCPIHSPYLTACELVCVPGRLMGTGASAADGAAASGHVSAVRQACWAATTARWASARRPQARFCGLPGLAAAACGVRGCVHA